MTSRLAEHATVVLCLALALGTLSCGNGGRSFLASRSSIEVDDGPLCGAGVEDHRTCHPEDFGDGHWTREERFPSFTVSEYSGRQDVREVAREIRAYYLGALYYEGDVHTYCKREAGSEEFLGDSRYPSDSTNLQVYDMREMIEKRVIRPMTTRLRSELSLRSRTDSSGIAARFYEAMMDEMRERIDASVLWFVIRYPGGVPDMARNDELRRCVSESRQERGALITGVAGYAMLKNNIDETLVSEATVFRALERAQAEYEFALDPGLRHSLAREWTDKLDRIAHVKLTRRDVTATAWPLWVQYD
jgi:hypothetical protein